jgi:hypothetical protein
MWRILTPRGASAVLRDKITSAYGLQNQAEYSLARAPDAADSVPFSHVKNMTGTRNVSAGDVLYTDVVHAL